VYLLIRKRALRLCSGQAVLREIPAISMAVCIIPTLPQMFNENRTFFGKKLLDAGFWMLDTRKKFYRGERRDRGGFLTMDYTPVR